MPLGTCLFYSGMTDKEMIFEFARPLLLLVFVQKAQIPKIVGVTEAVLTLCVLRVEARSIMFADSMKLR